MRSFAQLFAGRTDRYAIWRPSGELKGQKVDGKGDTKRDALPDGAYERHLAGEFRLGIIPIRLDGTVAWFAGDIDNYTIDLKALEAECQRLELPLVVCRTKSGGAHLYCFIADPKGIPAVDAIRLMRKWVTDLGYPKVEIFPKQSVISEESTGNWINIPYYNNGPECQNYAIGLSGERLALDQFLQLAHARSIKPREVAGLLKEDKAKKDAEDIFKHAPPCIQRMMGEGLGQNSGRNNALTHIGIFFKMAASDDWAEQLQAFNNEYFKPPLEADEVAYVIKSLRTHTKYQYLCKNEPMQSMCNKEVCLTRKWGVGPQRGTEYGDVEFRDLTMIKSDPPIWIWNINGFPINLTTDQLMSPSKFRNRIVEVCGVIVPLMKRPEHEKLVAQFMLTKKEELAPEEVSLNGMVMEVFRTWTSANIPRSKGVESVVRGLPYYDKHRGVILFRGPDFTQHFQSQTKSNNTTRDIWAAIRKYGGYLENQRVVSPELGQDNQIKLWHFPVNEQEVWFKLPDEQRF